MKKNKGFTLMELASAVVILIVLVSLSAFGISKMSQSIEQSRLDEMAKTIYMTAQNSMSTLSNEGTVYLLSYDVEDKDMTKQQKEPSDFEGSFLVIEDRNYRDYMLTVMHSDDAKMKLLVPDGSIETAGHWFIEYDTRNANVYGVFYYEEEDLIFYNTRSDMGMYRNSRDSRIANGNNVGYYGGYEKENVISATDRITSTISVTNGEELALDILIRMPNGHEADRIKAVINLEGAESGVVTRDYVLSASDLVERKSGTYKYRMVLDRLDNSFIDNENFLSENGDSLYYGEDVKITLNVNDVSDQRVSNTQSTARCNPLFDSVTLENYEAYVTVKYGRHLQNLAYVDAGIPIYVTQGKNISFSNEHEGEFADLYPDYDFVPIDNEFILSYDGQGYSISDLTIRSSANFDYAGLFEVFYGYELKNITMINTNISSNYIAGSVAGVVVSYDETYITNCYSFLDAKGYNGKSALTTRYLNSQCVGGLVGLIESGGYGVYISSSFASSSLYGSYAVGGLAGLTWGYVSVSDSYSGSYLASNGGMIGGLIAQCDSECDFQYCYSSGFVYGKASIYGGLTTSNAYVDTCYSILSVADVEIGTGYGLAGSDSNFKNVCYLAMNGLSGIGGGSGHGTMNFVLGSHFNGGKNTTPYHMSTEAMGCGTYTYWTLTNIMSNNDSIFIRNHYGDWYEANTGTGKLAYYEIYKDGSAGFATTGSYHLNNTKEIVQDGYALVYDSKNYDSARASKLITFYKTETVTLTHSFAVSDIVDYPVDGSSYYFLILPSNINNSFSNDGHFYKKLVIENNESGSNSIFYFNPSVARSVLETKSEPALPDLAYIRTARQLYALSMNYDRSIKNIDTLTYSLDKDIDYSAYNWLKVGLQTINHQNAIGSATNPFASKFSGNYHTISNVSFIANTKNEAGLFGHTANTAVIENLFISSLYNDAYITNNSYYFTSASASSKEVYVGGFVGVNEGIISNCGVANMVVKAVTSDVDSLSIGGFVGCNYGNITSCMSNIPVIETETTNTDVLYAGGFAGENDGTISFSYSYGTLKTNNILGSMSVCNAAGFAGNNKNSKYCYTNVHVSSEGASYGFAPKGGGYVTSCYYLNDGLYSYCRQNYDYDYNTSITSGISRTLSELEGYRIAGFSYVNENNQYDCEMISKYAFNLYSSLTDSEGAYVHYGNWVEHVDIPAAGFYYWEQHGDDIDYYMIDSKGNVYDNLCYATDDDKVITDYGYGFFVRGDQRIYKTISNSSWNSEYISSNSNDVNEILYNISRNSIQSVADQMMEETHWNKCKFYAYQSGLTDEENNIYGLYSKEIAPAMFTMVLDEGVFGWNFEPLFARTLVLSNQELKYDAVGAFGVRSIAQLQALNWYYGSENDKSFDHYVTYEGSLTTDPNYKTKNFVYLSSCDNLKPLKVVQMHDVNGEKFSFTPIASRAITAGNTPECFMGTYDGQSYRIKNVSLKSDYDCALGLFGVVGGFDNYSEKSVIRNVVMTADDGTITRTYMGDGITSGHLHEGTFNPGKVYNDNSSADPGSYGATAIDDSQAYVNNNGAYYIGTLVGYAGCDTLIENCAVSGYTIFDNTFIYGTNVMLSELVHGIGGLVGGTNSLFINSQNKNVTGKYLTTISSCTADTDIVIESFTASSPIVMYDSVVGIGGLVGLCDGKVTASYSGGSITISDASLYDENGTFKTVYNVGGIAGNKDITHLSSNYNTWNSGVQVNSTFEDCYSYTEFAFDINYTQVSTVAAIASMGESGLDMILNNCYYYLRKGMTADSFNYLKAPAKRGSYTIKNLTGLTYEDMSSDSFIDSLSANGRKFARAAVSYPISGSNAGRSYPFAAIIDYHGYKAHFGDWPREKNGVVLEKKTANLNFFTMKDGVSDITDTIEIEYYDNDGNRIPFTSLHLMVKFASSGGHSSDYVEYLFLNGRLMVVGLKDTSKLPGGVETITVYNNSIEDGDTITVKVTGAPIIEVIEDDPEADLYESEFIKNSNAKAYIINVYDENGRYFECDDAYFDVQYDTSLISGVKIYPTPDEGTFEMMIVAKDDEDPDYLIREGVVNITYRSVLSNNQYTKIDSNTVEIPVTVYPVTDYVYINYYDGDLLLMTYDYEFNWWNAYAEYSMYDSELNGREFRCWVDKDGNQYYPGDIIGNLRKNLDLYATYYYATVTLKDGMSGATLQTLYCSNGNFYSSMSSSQIITSVTKPSKAKYLFEDYRDEDGNLLTEGDCSLVILDDLQIYEDKIYYANWSYNAYKINFINEGSVIAVAEYEPHTDNLYTNGSTTAFHFFDDPEIYGKVFKGWYTAETDGSVLFNADTHKIASVMGKYNGSMWTHYGDFNVYALYQDDSTSVTLKGETVSEDRTFVVFNGDTELDGFTPDSKSHYQLLGYYDNNDNLIVNADGTFVSNTAYTTANVWSAVPVVQTLELTPKYKRIATEFIINGEDGFSMTYWVKANSTAVSTSSISDVFKRDGYRLDSFLDVENGSCLMDKDGTFTSKISNYSGTDGLWTQSAVDDYPQVVLEALYFRTSSQINFFNEGGTQCIASRTVNDYDTSVIYPVQTREHYYFLGYVDSDSKLIVDENGKLQANTTYTNENGEWTYGYSNKIVNLYAVLEKAESHIVLVDANNYNNEVILDCWVKENVNSLTEYTARYHDHYSLTGFFNDEDEMIVDAYGKFVASTKYTDDNGRWKDADYDITLKAKYSPAVETMITLVDSFGVEPYPNIQLYANNGDLGVDKAKLFPQKTLYEANGYYTDDTNTVRVINPDGTFVKNVAGYTDADGKWIHAYDGDEITLYAKFVEITCTVHFETNGGTPVADVEVAKGSTVTSKTTTQEHWAFAGWHTRLDAISLYDFNTPVTSDLTLYAFWTPLMRTVTFDAEGGSCNLNTAEVQDGKALGAWLKRLPVPTKDHYSFTDWYIGSVTTGNKLKLSTVVNADITVHADYKKVDSLITLTNGVDGTENRQYWLSNGDVKIKGFTAHTRNDYVLMGYAYEGKLCIYPDGTLVSSDYTDVYSEWAAAPNDVTFEAVWDLQSYKVAFVTNGGSSIAPRTVYKYSTLNPSTISTSYPKHTLVGWYTDAKLTQPFDFTKPIVSDTVLYAKWIETRYTVSFYDGDILYKEVSVLEGESVYDTLGEKITAEKKHYDFIGWYTSKTANPVNYFDLRDPVTKNISVYAGYEQRDSVITLVDPLISYEEKYWVSYGDKCIDGYDYRMWSAPAGRIMMGFTSSDGVTVVRTDGSFTTSTDADAYLKNGAWNLTRANYTFEVYYESFFYSVEFIMDGNVIKNASYMVMQGDTVYNVTAGKYPTVEKDGYYFIGWSSDANKFIKYDMDAPVYNHTRIYAYFEKTPQAAVRLHSSDYVTKFATEGDYVEYTVKNMDTEIADYAIKSDSFLMNDTRKGWTFTGWYYKDKTGNYTKVLNPDGSLERGLYYADGNLYYPEQKCDVYLDKAGVVFDLYAGWSKLGYFYILSEDGPADDVCLMMILDSDKVGSANALVTIGKKTNGYDTSELTVQSVSIRQGYDSKGKSYLYVDQETDTPNDIWSYYPSSGALMSNTQNNIGSKYTYLGYGQLKSGAGLCLTDRFGENGDMSTLWDWNKKYSTFATSNNASGTMVEVGLYCNGTYNASDKYLGKQKVYTYIVAERTFAEYE